MWPMAIVSVQPLGQMSGSIVRCQVGPSVGPFAQRGLDEALGLAIGFWRVGFGAQVLDFEQAQCLGVATGSEAGAVVGHDALNLNAMDPEEAQRVEEKAQAGATFSSGKISENGRRSPNADIPNQPRGCCFDLCDRR